jgi:hypothetical protein
VTLVELLIALALGALAVTVVLLAHHTLTRNSRLLDQRHRDAARLDPLVDQLRDDLHHLFVAPIGPAGEVAMENSATGLVRLAFLRLEPAGDREPVVTNRVLGIEYRRDPPSGELIRTARMLTGIESAAGRITTNRFLLDAPPPALHLHDGTQWSSNWIAGAQRPPGTPAPRPRAARIEWIAHPDPAATGPVHTVTLPLPLGLSATSRLARASNTTSEP